MKGWTSTASTTVESDTSKSHLFVVTEDEDGTWIVSERETTVYGHGRTLLEAMCDYCAALRSTLSIIESSPASERLQREAVSIRRFLDVG